MSPVYSLILRSTLNLTDVEKTAILAPDETEVVEIAAEQD